MPPLELRSDHCADFRASQRVLDRGAASVWPTIFQPLCFRRTPKLIRQSDPGGLHISLPLSGALRAVRGQEEAVCGPDSLCVVDTSRPVDRHGSDDASLHTGVGLEAPNTAAAAPQPARTGGPAAAVSAGRVRLPAGTTAHPTGERH
ncbi:hypothetical protein ACJ6WF_01000 [Streptomyces sp. MMS24-I2-30]|uniref:AraC-like ligand-binding domain-containing protein n=1 Tax=Streptomyces sp. MMS24-I2-30 TaxID=3351564 RepID=UPI003896E3EE